MLYSAGYFYESSFAAIVANSPGSESEAFFYIGSEHREDVDPSQGYLHVFDARTGNPVNTIGPVAGGLRAPLASYHGKLYGISTTGILYSFE